MCKVLIASHEALERLLLREMLCVIPQIYFLETSDGMTAVELARQYLPRLVVADYMLPKLNGIEVCRFVKAAPALSGVSVMVITAQIDPLYGRLASEAGADAFFVKPFEDTDLLRIVSKLLKR